jgi:hypothetical protein
MFLYRYVNDQPDPVFYRNGQTAPEGHFVIKGSPTLERHPPGGESPQYVRTVRRPIIVLD